MTLVKLQARTDDENTLIEILDGNLNVVPGSAQLGETTVEVRPGAYAVRFQIGTEYVQRIVILEPDKPVTFVELKDEDAPRFVTSAPVRQTQSTREFHREPARQLSMAPPESLPDWGPGDAELMVFARDIVDNRHNDPTKGLSLHNLKGAQIADLAKIGERNPELGWGGCHLALKAGAYRLRLSKSKKRFSEQIIYLCKGWQTQVFLLARGVGDSDLDGQVYLASTSVLFAKPWVGFDPDRQDLRWTESALRALNMSSNIPGSVRSEMFGEKFENPMLGIYAGLLHLRRKKIDSGLLLTVFDNLYRLVGPLPDVLAIGWGLALRDPAIMENSQFLEKINQSDKFKAPPMLRASWDVLVNASIERPEIVPTGSLTERASSRLTSGGPWFSWRGDPPAAQLAPDPTIALASNSLLIGILGKVLPSKLVLGLVTGSLGVALTYLAKVLGRMPMAGDLLYSSRYSDVERRVAQYVYPLVDKQLRELVDADKALGEEINQSVMERGFGADGLVNLLKIPANAALGAVWGLVRKLVLQPVIPHETMLPRFIVTEGHENNALESILTALQKQKTILRHLRSGETVNALALIWLLYRGSPSEHKAGTPSADDLGELLQKNEYAIGKKAATPEASALDLILADVRSKVLVILAKQVANGKITFAAGWQTQVLPDPTTYKAGALLPEPIESQANGASVTTVVTAG